MEKPKKEDNELSKEDEKILLKKAKKDFDSLLDEPSGELIPDLYFDNFDTFNNY